MQKLREAIRGSKFRTQERFSVETGINEALVSKYCRGLRKPSKQHQKILEKFLRDYNAKA